MGGEANKLIGSLRAQGLTYDDIIRKQQLYNFQTEKSRAGALKFANASADLTRIITSLSKFIAGALGDSMTKVVTEFTNWGSANKELIATGVQQFARGLYVIFSSLWMILRSMFKALSWVVDQMGGFERASQFITSGLLLFAVLKVVQAFSVLGAMIKHIPLLLRAIPIIGTLMLIADDIRSWASGGNSIMGLIVGDFDTWLPQFMEGLDVIKDLAVYAFDSLSSIIMGVFESIGDSIIDAVLAPINWIIEDINKLFASLNELGSSGIMKSLGLDFNIGAIDTISQSSAKQAIGNSVSGAVSTVSNFATDVVVNVANATSEQAQQLVQKAIVGSMEHERQKLQSPTK